MLQALNQIPFSGKCCIAIGVRSMGVQLRLSHCLIGTFRAEAWQHISILGTMGILRKNIVEKECRSMPNLLHFSRTRMLLIVPISQAGGRMATCNTRWMYFRAIMCTMLDMYLL